MDHASFQAAPYGCIGFSLNKMLLSRVNRLKFSPCSACQAMYPVGRAEVKWFYSPLGPRTSLKHSRDLPGFVSLVSLSVSLMRLSAP